MDLTNEDVADVLALLDSLPYDSLDLETSQFRLTLRRAPGGGWTEESQALADPVVLAPAPDGATATSAANDSGRAGGTAAGTTSGPAPAPAPAAAAQAGTAQAGTAQAGTAQAGTAQAGTATDGGDSAADGLAVVRTPLPGTFYRAPRPGADPFVQVGDAVTPDTVVAIVETMKLMNPVHAGTAGRVARIALENGDFAPLGTTLMLIEPA